LGNRLFTDECLRCGTKLILDHMGNFNKYHCCSACTEWIHKSVYEVMKKKRKGSRSAGIEKKNMRHITKMGVEPE